MRRLSNTVLATLAILCAVGTTVAALAPAFVIPTNADEGWLLYAAGRILDGAVLGRDVLDVNPPLIVWLKAPIVAAARALDLPPALTWAVAVQALVLAASLAALLILTRTKALGRPQDRMAWVLLCYVILTLGPFYEQGQREHLAAILVLPFVLLCGVRAAGTAIPAPKGALLGAVAGVGFAIKPFFLAPLAMLVVYARRRGASPLKPETLAVLAFGVAYIIAVSVAARPWIEGVLQIGGLYRKYLPADPVDLLARFLITGWPALMAGLLLLSIRRAYPRWPITGALVAASAGFVLSALIQFKVWSYLWVPAYAFGALALGASLIESRGVSAVRFQRGVAAFGLGLVLATQAQSMVHWVRRTAAFRAAEGDEYRAFRDRLATLAAGGNALILSVNHGETFPVIADAGAQWPLREPSLWPLVALHPEARQPGPTIASPVDPPDPDEQKWLTRLAEDLERNPPTVIVWVRAETTQPKFHPARRFDYLAYLSHDPRIAAVLKRYVAADSLNGAIFALRKAVAQGSPPGPDSAAHD